MRLQLFSPSLSPISWRARTRSAARPSEWQRAEGRPARRHWGTQHEPDWALAGPLSQVIVSRSSCAVSVITGAPPHPAHHLRHHPAADRRRVKTACGPASRFIAISCTGAIGGRPQLHRSHIERLTMNIAAVKTRTTQSRTRRNRPGRGINVSWPSGICLMSFEINESALRLPSRAIASSASPDHRR